MNCKLCLKSGKIVNSHIIPEFNYKPMYDDKHRFLRVDVENNEQKISFPQKGYREYLLCESCEQEINNYEKHVHSFLFGGSKFGFSVDDGCCFIKGLDYAKTKLYFLSLLWRMSITTHEFFRNVSLGPHEDLIREMITSANPGDPTKYGTICIAPEVEGTLMKGWMTEPERVKIDGYASYRIIIGGLLYFFIVDKRSISAPWNECFIQQDGDWKILTMNTSRLPFLRDLFSSVAKTAKTKK